MRQERQISDREAVSAVLAGQRDTFGLLVQRHLPAVRALALSRTGHYADAEDVVQEAFLRAFMYLNTLKERGRFGSWMAAITVNVSRRLLAKRLRREEIAGALRDMEATVSPEVERRDLRAAVIEQVHRLTVPHRDVLLLHYFGGKTVLETAELLGISEEAAKKRLQRARAALGEQIARTLSGELRSVAAEDEHRSRKIMGVLLLMRPPWQIAPDAQCPAPGPPAKGPGRLPELLPWRLAPGRWAAGLLLGLVLAGAGLGFGRTGQPAENEPLLTKPVAATLSAATSTATAEPVETARSAEESQPGQDRKRSVSPAPLGGTGRRSVPASSWNAAPATTFPSSRTGVSRGMTVSAGRTSMAHNRPPLSLRNSSSDATAQNNSQDLRVRRLKMHNVPLRDVLDAALRPLNLDYRVENGYIRIARPDQFREAVHSELETRVYELQNGGADTLPKIVVHQ